MNLHKHVVYWVLLLTLASLSCIVSKILPEYAWLCGWFGGITFGFALESLHELTSKKEGPG